LIDNESLTSGVLSYSCCEILIVSCQLLLRNLKLAHGTERYVNFQIFCCILHFLNYIPAALIAFNVKYFEIQSIIAYRIIQFLAFHGALYYLFVFVCFAVILWRIFIKSKTGIQDAILIIYETVQFEKWKQNHYPQSVQNIEDMEMSDSNSDISKGSSEENSNSDCSICLETFDSKEMVCRLNCKHYYHLNCIYTWLTHQNSKNLCPLCKEANKLEDV